jgi:hypothetical protein
MFFPAIDGFRQMLDENSTADDVLKNMDLRGRRFLITGVSARLGIESARALCARGADVVGAVRDLGKARRATRPVRASAAASGGSFRLESLDLASLASVRTCACRAAWRPWASGARNTSTRWRRLGVPSRSEADVAGFGPRDGHGHPPGGERMPKRTAFATPSRKASSFGACLSSSR